MATNKKPSARVTHKRCAGCMRHLPIKEFIKGSFRCLACRNEYRREWRAKRNDSQRLHEYARIRAWRKGREFTLKTSDIVIPEICPVLGTPMKRPSIDRLDPTRGYTPDNIRVISVRANTLRGDATVAELELLLEDARKIEAKLAARANEANEAQ